MGTEEGSKNQPVTVEEFLRDMTLDVNAAKFKNWVDALDGSSEDERRAAIRKFEETLKGNPGGPDAYNNWGNALYALKRYDEAIEKYEKATQIQPDYLFAHNNWGLALYALKRYDEAIEKYEKTTQIDPNYADAYSNWGLALHALKRYDEAIQKCEMAVKIKPDLVSAYKNWGNALFSLMRYNEAVEKYLTAVKLDSGVIPYGNWVVALDHLPKNERGEAARRFEELTKGRPGEVDAYNNWGNALYALADTDSYAEAIGKYQKVLQIDSQNPAGYFGWGIVLEAMKRYDEAIEKYEAVCKIDPLDPYPCHNIANLFFRRGMYKEGWIRWSKTREVYQKAQKQGTPKSRTADFYLYYGSLFHEVFRQLSDAEKAYTDGLILDPDATDILASLVDLYLKSAEENPEARTDFYWKAKEAQEKAVRLLSRALKEREDWETRLLLGKLFIKMERYDEAKTHLFEALQREKRSAELYAAAGVLYSRMEDFREALGYFKSSLEQDPDDLNVWSNLAETYLKLGMKDKAEVEYKRILRIAPEHVESHLGLGEVFLAMGGDDEDMYDRAIGCFSSALDLAREEGRGSKKFSRKEEAAALHSLAYARVGFYEKAPAIIKDEKYLTQALADFRDCVKLDADDHKAGRSKQKLAKRLNRFSPRSFADKIAPWIVFGLSLIVFIFSQSTYYFGRPALQKPITDVGYYALLTFGSLIFMVAGLYLPQILKLKVGGIELEKKPIEQITTSVSLGISR